MEITIEEVVGQSLFDPTKRVVRKGTKKLFRVRVNGMDSGFIQNREGAKLMMTERFTLEDMKVIESEVSRQLAELTERPPALVKSVMPPEVPEGFNQQEDEGFSDDDFDS